MKMESIMWRLIPLLAFLAIALALPVVRFDYGESPYYPPPPGWTRYFTYFLAADYDYFWRIRIVTNATPFWLLTGIIALLILSPSLANWRIDLVASLAVSSYTIGAWMVFLQYFFIQPRTFLSVYAPPIIPVVGLVFVVASRTLNYLNAKRQSQLELA